MMRPMKITAVLQDGRIAGTEPWFPLDGILAAEWMRRHHPEAYYNAGSHMLINGLIISELPFERRGAGNLWYWACSFNTEPPLGEYVMHWHKRFDDHLEKYVDFGGRRGRINVKSGRYKAYRMPLVVQLFDRLTWYAVGDPEAVRDLCSAVTHIGKKTSQGLGAVDYWEVEPWPEDWSEAKGGRLTRAVPAELDLPEGAGAVRLRVYGVRPPYWHSEHQKLCYMPEVVPVAAVEGERG
jgi:CRISPR type IV-associated protein Csf3